MRNERKEGAARRLSVMAPLLLFVLVFVVCCGVVSCVFARANAISRSAAVYDDAVALCRDRAARFRAGEPLAETAYFDADLQPCAEADAVYCVTASVTVADGVETAALAAGEAGQEPVYRLEAAACRGG